MLATALAAGVGQPLHFTIEPQSQRATSLERCVVVGPVGGLVALLGGDSFTHGAGAYLLLAWQLCNKAHLMDELGKIRRVVQKVIPDAPHEVLLVLDGSTGQNAYEQAKQFTKATEVNALAVTKLDGTAKGGVVIGISDQFKIPVKYIGLGEKMTDLQVFNKEEFVKSLFE